jgi:hypothetical protein
VIVAAGRFSEESPDQKALRDYHEQTILLPADPSIRPNPRFIALTSMPELKGLQLASARPAKSA